MNFCEENTKLPICQCEINNNNNNNPLQCRALPVLSVHTELWYCLLHPQPAPVFDMVLRPLEHCYWDYPVAEVVLLAIFYATLERGKRSLMNAEDGWTSTISRDPSIIVDPSDMSEYQAVSSGR